MSRERRFEKNRAPKKATSVPMRWPSAAIATPPALLIPGVVFVRCVYRCCVRGVVVCPGVPVSRYKKIPEAVCGLGYCGVCGYAACTCVATLCASSCSLCFHPFARAQLMKLRMFHVRCIASLSVVVVGLSSVSCLPSWVRMLMVLLMIVACIMVCLSLLLILIIISTLDVNVKCAYIRVCRAYRVL